MYYAISEKEYFSQLSNLYLFCKRKTAHDQFWRTIHASHCVISFSIAINIDIGITSGIPYSEQLETINYKQLCPLEIQSF